MTTSLHLQGVSLAYPARGRKDTPQVLDNVHLEARGGEIIGIEGRSGSGKTTLLNVAAGMLRPTTGVVQWGDEEIWQHSDSWRREQRRHRFGYVLQSAGLVDSLTAAENVALAGMGLAPMSTLRDRSLELLDRLGVGSSARLFPGQLSGGERQRVGVARALLNKPAVLLVDEPTANLDRVSAGAVTRILAELCQPERAIVVASHDPHVIGIATRVYTLE